MAKINALVNVVRDEVSNLSNNFGVKMNIGDSIDNNRVITVRQTIRYLNNDPTVRTVGQDLDTVYSFLLKQGLFKKLRRNKNRSDAYDINEFFTVFNRYVNNNPVLKSVLGRKISPAV
jgi:hypothetical protein